MKTLLTIAAILILLATVAGAATSVKSSKSNSSERFSAKNLSASTEVSGPDGTATVLTTPANADFLLTQVCVGDANGGIQINAAGLGPVAIVPPASCQSFDGVVLPRNAAITCSTGPDAAAGTYFCTIFGLQGTASLF